MTKRTPPATKPRKRRTESPPKPGTSLRPVPPGASKGKDTRYLDIREGDELDEAQLATWVKQAAELPGWVP